MNIDSLMWVTIKQFQSLTFWPKKTILSAIQAGSLVFRYVKGSELEENEVRGRYQLSIRNLSHDILKRYLQKEIQKIELRKDSEKNNELLVSLENATSLLKARDIQNKIKYRSMKPFQQRSVARWLPIMLSPFDRKKIIQYLKKNNIPIGSYYIIRKKWIESGGDFDVLKTGYGHPQPSLKRCFKSLV